MSYYCHSCGTVIEEDEDTLCGKCKIMNNNTNESDEAARLKSIIKEIYDTTIDGMSSYKWGQVFRIVAKEVESWPKSAPQKKKVLRPAWEILREAQERNVLMADDDNGVLIDLGSRVFTMVDVITNHEILEEAPDWFFTTEEAKR